MVTDFELAEMTHLFMHTPAIELFCTPCDGLRLYDSSQKIPIRQSIAVATFVLYICRNCRTSWKNYALTAAYRSGMWHVTKYGEQPAFGPPIPAKTISLLGPDRDQFLKGRRCENQGLGVGAFVYYRRVVENQKVRIFEAIIRVSQHLDADPELIEELERAKAETQFTKAVGVIKHALPQTLLINGANPLTLLHSALSEGVHALNDAQCLDFAHSVRIVLVEFADRLSQAMKDDVELNQAVTRLHQVRRTRSAPTGE